MKSNISSNAHWIHGIFNQSLFKSLNKTFTQNRGRSNVLGKFRYRFADTISFRLHRKFVFKTYANRQNEYLNFCEIIRTYFNFSVPPIPGI